MTQLNPENYDKIMTIFVAKSQSACAKSYNHPWLYTSWKESKYGVFSGPIFPVFGPEKIRKTCLDSFHAALNSYI